jgi:WD40-like Beta Propeller Repeat
MNRMRGALLAAAIVVGAAATTASAMHFSSWNEAQKIDEMAGNSTELNTSSLDGCPIQSPDGLSLYMASNRPGGQGLLDIWVARRASKDAPFGAPENLGEPVNSAADDFCPTPVRGGGLFFVSREALPGSCGLGDIYFTRFNPVHGWSEPEHLACAPDGPNSPLDEQGPSYFEAGGAAYLYFSSGSGAVPGDIYVSDRLADGSFGPASPVGELNSTVNDIQPNVRKDGRELVFSSNRSGGAGGQDIWAASRASVDDAWAAPVNLGGTVNKPLGESRPSLSWDGQQLLFGRAGPVGTGEGGTGQSDIYVTTREKAAGS